MAKVTFLNWNPFSSATPALTTVQGRKPKKNRVTLYLELNQTNLQGAGGAATVAAVNSAFDQFAAWSSSSTGNRSKIEITINGKTLVLTKGFEVLETVVSGTAQGQKTFLTKRGWTDYISPSLTASAQPSGVTEGQTITYSITNNGFLPGTVLSYVIGGTISAADVLGGSGVLTGTRTVKADGTLDPVTIQINNDQLLEPIETAIFTVSALSPTGANVTTSATASVQDTTPASQIIVTAQPSSVSEGSQLAFQIATVSLAPGTVLTYAIAGLDAADVLGGAAVLNGTRIVGVDGSVAPVVIAIASDLIIGETNIATITVSGVNGSGTPISASASASVVDTSPATIDLTTAANLFNESAQVANLTFAAPVVPGIGPGFSTGFNTLQNIDSLAGGSGRDSLLAELTGGSLVQPIALQSIEVISVSALAGGDSELSLLTTTGVDTLRNYSSVSKLIFSNIPAVNGGPQLPSLEILGTNSETELSFQPVAVAPGGQTLNITTTASGTGGTPLKITTGPGIEAAVITDSVQVPGFLVDYDLSDFDVPVISISSPNAVDLAGLVNSNTISIDGSGIQGAFTVDLNAQPAGVSIQGGAGADVITGRNGSSTLVGNAGNDTLNGLAGSDSLDGGLGDDDIFAAGGNNNIVGGLGDDFIRATNGDDSASGNEGDDNINLSGGNNTATGGAGNDVIGTDAGNDTISGGLGDDGIISGDGNDTVAGDEGNDVIDFGGGLDDVSGGVGDDRLIGTLTPGLIGSTDTIDGGPGTDTLVITAFNADTVATSGVGMPFVNNIEILEVSDQVGTFGLDNEVDVSLIDSTIATVNVLAGTGATPSVFTFNTGSSTINFGATLNGDASFNVGGAGTADSLTINGPGTGDYLNGQNLTFNGFDANTVTINTGLTNQTIGNIIANPTPGQDSRFNFSGIGGVTIALAGAPVLPSAGNLILDFSGISDPVAVIAPNAIVGGSNVLFGSTVSILGSAGADSFTGDADQANTINAAAGNDTVVVGLNNDVVNGGDGNDTITPGAGNDTINGDAGNDRVNAAGDLTLLDVFNGGDGVDTIQLTGELSSLIPPFNTGYSASDLAGVSNFEVLELDVLDSPAETTIQDLYNFTVNNNILSTVNLTDADDDGLGFAELLNAPGTLTNLGVLETLTGASLVRRINTASDALTVTLDGGADLTTLILNDEESLTFVVNGDSTIDTLKAISLQSLTITGTGTLTFTNPLNLGLGTLTTVDLSGLVATAPIQLDLSGSAAPVTFTGPSNTVFTGSYQLNLVTGAGADTIVATGFGANTINSDGGNDTIQTGSLADSLIAGLGNDNVSSGDGNDTVVAAEGNDTVSAADGDDLVTGDTGNIAGNDNLSGGAGNDTLSAGLGADTIDGGIGTDTYVAGFTVTPPPGTQDPAGTGVIQGLVINLSSASVQDSYIEAATGNALSIAGTLAAVAPGSTNYLYTTPTPLFGSTVSDVLSSIENAVGTDGADFLIGSTADNILDGADGDDTIQAGDGADTLIGGLGDDALYADAGSDSILAGLGDDTISGGAGIDTITGGGGFNTFIQNQGDSAFITGGSLTGGGGGADSLSNGDFLTFGFGVDVVTDFDSFTDVLDTFPGTATDTAGVAFGTYTSGDGYYTRGAFNVGTGVFTVDYAAGADILYFESLVTNAGTGFQLSDIGNGAVVLQGAGTTGFNPAGNII
jgi:Ca2+-binding RTX toxin-like protein